MTKRKRTNSSSDEVISVETTHILDLNDDCPLSVFSFLPTCVHLCAVKETCERFVTPAKYEFEARYRHQPFILGSESYDLVGPADFSGATKVLRHFGAFIRILSVHDIIEKEDCFLWDHIFGGCTALEKLIVSECFLDGVTDNNNHRQRSQLESLHVRNCFGNDRHYPKIFNSFSQLKRLVIDCKYIIFKCGFFESRFSELEEITIRRNGILPPTIIASLKSFIENHAKLKKIDFNLKFIDEETVDCIASYSKNLESLSFLCTKFTNFGKIAAELACLDLKELQFTIPEGSEFDIPPFIEKLSKRNRLHTLCILGLARESSSALYKAISKVTSSRTLKLEDYLFVGTNESSMDIIWKELELEHLHVISFGPILRVEIDHFIPVIEKINMLKSLTFICGCTRRNERMLVKVYRQWTNARKLADSGFPPMKMFVCRFGWERISPAWVADPKSNTNLVSIQ